MRLPKKWRKRYEARVKELHADLMNMIDSFEGTYAGLKKCGANIPDYLEQSQKLREIVDRSRDALLQEQDFELLFDAQDALLKKLDELTSQVTRESDRIFRKTFGCDVSEIHTIKSIALQ